MATVSSPASSLGDKGPTQRVDECRGQLMSGKAGGAHRIPLGSRAGSPLPRWPLACPVRPGGASSALAGSRQPEQVRGERGASWPPPPPNACRARPSPLGVWPTHPRREPMQAAHPPENSSGALWVWGPCLPPEWEPSGAGLAAEAAGGPQNPGRGQVWLASRFPPCSSVLGYRSPFLREPREPMTLKWSNGPLPSLCPRLWLWEKTLNPEFPPSASGTPPGRRYGDPSCITQSPSGPEQGPSAL